MTEPCRCSECKDPELVEEINRLNKEVAEARDFAIDLMHMIWGNQNHPNSWPDWASEYAKENL